MTTLAEFMIVVGVGNRPPMLDKAMYNSWESRMLLYIKGKKNGRMMLESIENEPLVHPTIEVYGDDLIACLNKAMAFMSSLVASRFPSTNNQLRTSFNPRNQATIQDARVTVQQVQGRQGQSFAGTGTKGNATSSRGNNAAGQERVVKCYKYQGEGHMARQFLDEEELAFLADPGITDCHDVQPTIIYNAAFQTDNLDAYDFDCDDISSAKAVLMANLSSYGSDVLSEVLLVDNKYLVNDNLEIDRLEQDNDHLCELLLSQDIVYICVNSFALRNDCHEMQQGFIYEYNENLILKVELTKKGQMVEKTIFDEVVLTCS
nr:hypothetical protein [Tanacetum cinerariifolium]